MPWRYMDKYGRTLYDIMQGDLIWRSMGYLRISQDFLFEYLFQDMSTRESKRYPESPKISEDIHHIPPSPRISEDLKCGELLDVQMAGVTATCMRSTCGCGILSVASYTWVVWLWRRLTVHDQMKFAAFSSMYQYNLLCTSMYLYVL